MSFMDGRDYGSKPGSGGGAGSGAEAASRRERLRKLALETIDLAKDPYLLRNHTGQYECRLCLTVHANEGSYLAHTQGKKHQQNIAKRAAREAADASAGVGAAAARKRPRIEPRRTVKIGRPGYRVTKQFDPRACQRSLLFQVELPEIEEGLQPRHRFMSSYEQKVEPWDKRYQFLLVAAEPYETIAFKIPNMEVDKAPAHLHVHWEPDKKVYTLQIYLKGGVRGGAGPNIARSMPSEGRGPQGPAAGQSERAGQAGAGGTNDFLPGGPPSGVPPRGIPPPGMLPSGMPPPGVPPPGMLPPRMPLPGMLPPRMPAPGVPQGMPPPNLTGALPPTMPPGMMPPPNMPPPPGMMLPGMQPPPGMPRRGP